MKACLKQIAYGAGICATGLAVVFSAAGCRTAKPITTGSIEEAVPAHRLTFGVIREEVRVSYDKVTLEPSGSVTNRFVFPVSYRVEGAATLDELQVLFDRHREAMGKGPASIHDDSAIEFLEVMDTLGGTVLPDFTVREEDVRVMTPVILEPWLRKIRRELGIATGQDAPPRPRLDRP